MRGGFIKNTTSIRQALSSNILNTFNFKLIWLLELLHNKALLQIMKHDQKLIQKLLI
jgi:hypothetical protein